MIALPIYQILFYVFAAVAIISAGFVITSRQPVRAILFLVLTFFASSVLWMMLQAEFLALVLIFVYVGAVMTLFLFVVMMLNLDLSTLQEKFIRYLPLGLIVMILFVGAMIFAMHATNFGAATAFTAAPANYNNTASMGQLLFTQYLYPFEIAAVILLVAIIAAVALAFHGPKGSKRQKISQQQAVTKQSRLRIIKMKADQP